jgi:beta-glucosidase
MTVKCITHLAAALIAGGFAAHAANASTSALPQNTAIVPAPASGGTAAWHGRYLHYLAQAKPGSIELLFVGDSITQGWGDKGSNVWAKYYASRRAANFGISGDRTQHILWRMESGGLEGLKPKVVVLMIGTNNTGNEKDGSGPRNTPEQAIAGVTGVVKGLRDRLPESKLLLLAIFPRGAPNSLQRAQVRQINQAIARLANSTKVTFLDIGDRFLAADGSIPPDVMPDGLHPAERGYRIWAEAMEPVLRKLLAEQKSP